MVQAIPRSKACLTERQQFWLDHLWVCREQGQTLRGYAKPMDCRSVGCTPRNAPSVLSS